MPLPNQAIRTQSFSSSRQLLPGDWAQSVVDAAYSFQTLAAVAPPSQATAAPVNATSIELTSSAAAGVLLPPSFPGAEFAMLNPSANTVTVYGTGADVIQNATTTYAAAATGVDIVTLRSYIFRCIKQGFWQRVLTS